MQPKQLKYILLLVWRGYSSLAWACVIQVLSLSFPSLLQNGNYSWILAHSVMVSTTVLDYTIKYIYLPIYNMHRGKYVGLNSEHA